MSMSVSESEESGEDTSSLLSRSTRAGGSPSATATDPGAVLALPGAAAAGQEKRNCLAHSESGTLTGWQPAWRR